MSKREVSPIVSAVAGGFLLLSTGCTSIEEPRVYVTNITPTTSTAFEQRVRVDMRLENPNDMDLSVRGMDFELDVDDLRFTRGVSGREFTVPALGEATCSMVTSTSAFDRLRRAVELPERPEIEYRMQGELHLARGPVRSVDFDSTEAFAELSGFAPGLVDSMAPAVRMD